MRRLTLCLLPVLFAACPHDVPGVNCDGDTDCPNGGHCRDGICLESGFESLVLDSPAADSTVPQTFEATAHLTPAGAQATPPASLKLIVSRDGAAAQEVSLPLREGLEYQGPVTVQTTGAHQLRAESPETGLQSASVAIVVVPGCSGHAECGRCRACRGGVCVDQGATEDLGDECPEEPCATGFCDGAGGCGLKPASTVCRESSGACDLEEHCTGEDAACPPDAFEPETTVCRSAAGDCDVEERCAGSADCPDDSFKDATVECRAAAGACDVAESCAGDSASCPVDELMPEGSACGPQSCVADLYTPAATCDAQGACVEGASVSCGNYFCDEAGCLTSCSANSDCVFGLCDLRDGTCPGDVVEVDCAADSGALQTAIDACVGGSACYLHLTAGVCGEIAIQNVDLYIQGSAGAAIDPATDGPAVSVREDAGETTKVAIAGVTIQGASGAAGNGMTCAGLDGANPEISIIGCTIGRPEAGANNAGAGLTASNATVTVTASTVQNNSGAGLTASNATVTVTASTVQNNSGAGLALINSDFSITNSVIAMNGMGNGSYGVDVFANTNLSTKDFRHNTVVKNGNGMTCAGSGGTTAIDHSLFWNPGVTEVSGCTAEPTSDIPGVEDSCANAAAEPGFIRLQPPGTDYHLLPSSPCRDQLACAPQVAVDIDGDPRPQPVGGLCDVGADEVP